MALDGKLLALARKQLDDIRHHNEDLQSARRREVYARIPRVRQIDGALQGQMRRLAQVTMAGGKTLADDLAALEAENRALQDERRARLAGAGFDPDYTGEVYDCPDCRDTGYVNGKLCHCLRRLYNAQVTKHLSKLLRGDEQFSGFDLSFYPDIPDRNGDNPRECMSIIRDFCEAYGRTSSFPAARGWARPFCPPASPKWCRKTAGPWLTTARPPVWGRSKKSGSPGTGTKRPPPGPLCGSICPAI